MHTSPQRVRPAAQAHSPSTHWPLRVASPAQDLPQAPQESESICRLTHWSPQRVRPVLHTLQGWGGGEACGVGGGMGCTCASAGLQGQALAARVLRRSCSPAQLPRSFFSPSGLSQPSALPSRAPNPDAPLVVAAVLERAAGRGQGAALALLGVAGAGLAGAADIAARAAAVNEGRCRHRGEGWWGRAAGRRGAVQRRRRGQRGMLRQSPSPPAHLAGRLPLTQTPLQSSLGRLHLGGASKSLPGCVGDERRSVAAARPEAAQVYARPACPPPRAPL